MEHLCDHKADYKHHLTKEYLKFLEQSVMQICLREGLHQVDLVSPEPLIYVQEHGYDSQEQMKDELEQIRGKLHEAENEPI